MGEKMSIQEWRPWFAWFPVKASADGKIAFLRFVERRATRIDLYGVMDAEIRLPDHAPAQVCWMEYETVAAFFVIAYLVCFIAASVGIVALLSAIIGEPSWAFSKG